MRGPQTFIQCCEEIMASCVEVLLIDQSDFVNKRNWFSLEGFSRLEATLHNFGGND